MNKYKQQLQTCAVFLLLWNASSDSDSKYEYIWHSECPMAARCLSNVKKMLLGMQLCLSLNIYTVEGLPGYTCSECKSDTKNRDNIARIS